MKHGLLSIVLLAMLVSCDSMLPGKTEPQNTSDSIVADNIVADSLVKENIPPPQADSSIDTKNISAWEIIRFAKTLQGVPYKYASSDPKEGFDCSGFITYVFNHFGIAVPRSSIDFTNVGKTVDKLQAKAGDLILFTGTDTLDTRVGHMGIITENTDSLRFIHSTSGKKYGVTITALNEYYLKRFVKVIRILNAVY